MTVTEISYNRQNITEIINQLPKDVIYKFTKFINKLGDVCNLSLVNKHYFQVIFNNTFPIWQFLLKSYFHSSFQNKPLAQAPRMGCLFLVQMMKRSTSGALPRFQNKPNEAKILLKKGTSIILLLLQAAAY